MHTIVTIAAVVAVFAAIVAVRGAIRVRRGGAYACGHRGHHGPGGGDSGRWGGYGLRRALAKLDLGPAQEKVVREEVTQLRALLRAEREGVSAMRADLAGALGAETLDHAAVDAALQRPEAALGRVRAEVGAAIARIHAVLDSEQRARLAKLLEGGRFGMAH